jgi:hypothetical protein
MFFNFEVDAREDSSSSPNITSRPIPLRRISQIARNSGFDRIESVETFHEGLGGRSAKSETAPVVENGGAFTHESESSEKPSGDVKLVEAVRKSLHGWRQSRWGGFEY